MREERSAEVPEVGGGEAQDGSGGFVGQGAAGMLGRVLDGWGFALCSVVGLPRAGSVGGR